MLAAACIDEDHVRRRAAALHELASRSRAPSPTSQLYSISLLTTDRPEADGGGGGEDDGVMACYTYTAKSSLQ